MNSDRSSSKALVPRVQRGRLWAFLISDEYYKPTIWEILINVDVIWFYGEWMVIWERCGSVEECLTRDRGPHQRHCAESLRKNISPSLVLVQPRKTSHFITEILLMGRKESNQTNKNDNYTIKLPKVSLVRRCLRNVVFFQAPSMDVDGNNEGLVVEHASFSCSAPGCKYISQWKANVRRHEKQHINIDAPSQADLSLRALW